MNDMAPADYAALAEKAAGRARFQGLATEAEWKVETLRSHAPRILRDVEQLKKAHRYPYAVMLPEDLNPGDYGGDDATDRRAEFCGLPVMWGDRFALLVEVGR